MRERIAEIGHQALAGQRLSRPDVLLLARAATSEPFELIHWAHKLRRQNFGNEVRVCSIVAGKLGACKEDCKWCAQSIQSASGGKNAKRATASEIHAAARSAAANRAGSMGIVNSGRRPARRDLDEVTAAARHVLTDEQCHIELCASLGELTADQAAQLAAAGIRRYNHNLETSRRFFPNVVTTHSYQGRIETLKAARQAGMKLCCGGLMGLGETCQDRAELALAIRDEVAPDVTPLNFLQPMPGTALEDAQPLEAMEILGIIAMFRLVLPKVDLKVAGGREHNLRDLQSWIFHAGATSCIIGSYLTTTGRDPHDDLQMIEDLGLTIVRELRVPAEEMTL